MDTSRQCCQSSHYMSANHSCTSSHTQGTVQCEYQCIAELASATNVLTMCVQNPQPKQNKNRNPPYLQWGFYLLQQVQQARQAQAPLVDQLTQHQAQVVLSQQRSRLCVSGWQQEQQQGVCSEGVAPVHLARPHNVKKIGEELLDGLWVWDPCRLHT